LHNNRQRGKVKKENYGNEGEKGWRKIKNNHISTSTSIKYAILRFIIIFCKRFISDRVSLIKQFKQFSSLAGFARRRNWEELFHGWEKRKSLSSSLIASCTKERLKNDEKDANWNVRIV
jgi:hypothetical protein